MLYPFISLLIINIIFMMNNSLANVKYIEAFKTIINQKQNLSIVQDNENILRILNTTCIYSPDKCYRKYGENVKQITNQDIQNYAYKLQNNISNSKLNIKNVSIEEIFNSVDFNKFNFNILYEVDNESDRKILFNHYQVYHNRENDFQTNSLVCENGEGAPCPTSTNILLNSPISYDALFKIIESKAIYLKNLATEIQPTDDDFLDKYNYINQEFITHFHNLDDTYINNYVDNILIQKKSRLPKQRYMDILNNIKTLSADIYNINENKKTEYDNS